MRMQDRPKLNFNNEKISERVQQLTGLKKNQADLAVIATIRAISEELQSGTPVTLRNVGRIYWRMSAPRTIPRKVLKTHVIEEIHCPPRPKLKFKVSAWLEKQLKGVTPTAVEYPQKWSHERLFLSPSQAQALAGPSNPPSEAADASATPAQE